MSLSLLWSLAVEVSRDVEIGPRVAIPVACPRGGEGGLNLRAWGCGCFRGPESGALAVQPRPLGRVAWTTMEGRRGALLTPALGTKRVWGGLQRLFIRASVRTGMVVEQVGIFYPCGMIF